MGAFFYTGRGWRYQFQRNKQTYSHGWFETKVEAIKAQEEHRERVIYYGGTHKHKSVIQNKNNSTTVGERTEGVVLAAMLMAGKKVLIPFGYGHRYDLVVDTGYSFIRVQCKTGRIYRGKVEFNTSSVSHATNKREDYRRDIDYFAVYCPSLEKIYLIPVNHMPKSTGGLRLEPPQHNNGKKIRFAADYEFEIMVDKI